MTGPEYRPDPIAWVFVGLIGACAAVVLGMLFLR